VQHEQQNFCGDGERPLFYKWKQKLLKKNGKAVTVGQKKKRGGEEWLGWLSLKGQKERKYAKQGYPRQTEGTGKKGR